MLWWPGWDSIESTGFWRDFYFWFGIICLCLLGFSEAISHFYGLRRDGLVAAAETVRADAQKTEDQRRDQEAAELQDRLSKAKTLNLPRVLTSEQQDRIVSALKLFAGTRFDIAVTAGDLEAEIFIDAVEAILHKAGWTQVDWASDTIILSRRHKYSVGIRTSTNLGVGLAKDHNGALEVTVTAFVNAFNAEGITSGGGVLNDDFPNKSKDMLHIFVGHKAL
jgi:hypothetical protein